MPLHISNIRAYHQEVKIVLYSLWYRHINQLDAQFCASSWLITKIFIFMSLLCTSLEHLVMPSLKYGHKV